VAGVRIPGNPRERHCARYRGHTHAPARKP
jgi:hypothetical protein